MREALERLAVSSHDSLTTEHTHRICSTLVQWTYDKLMASGIDTPPFIDDPSKRVGACMRYDNEQKTIASFAWLFWALSSDHLGHWEIGFTRQPYEQIIEDSALICAALLDPYLYSNEQLYRATIIRRINTHIRSEEAFAMVYNYLKALIHDTR